VTDRGRCHDPVRDLADRFHRRWLEENPCAVRRCLSCCHVPPIPSVPVSLSVPGFSGLRRPRPRAPALLAGAVGENGMRIAGANDLGDGLAVCRVVLSEPFECVTAAEPDRGPVAGELLNRLGV
jgi:hypothetical protein